MTNQLNQFIRGGWTLLRLIAVVCSSITTILSSLLPLFLYTSFSVGYLSLMFVFLSVGAVTIHGLLTHLFNDYSDFLSGTDEHSPAILSGGSRVIQKGIIKPQFVWQLGKWLAIMLLGVAIMMTFFDQWKISVLIVVGVWAAASYSLPPLRLSYRPFVGEWLSLFPSIFFLGLAGPWLILESVPKWAVQNAVINALVCMAWVMVHHIPDLDADQKAVPVKQTTVVWFTNTFGQFYARFPAMLYLLIAGTFTIWIGFNRIWAAYFLIIMLSIALFLVIKLDIKNYQQVTNNEKALLLIATIIGVVLGIF